MWRLVGSRIVSVQPPPSYDDLLGENAVLRSMVAELTVRLEQAMGRIADLEARLKQSSSNSSRPVCHEREGGVRM